MAWGSLKQTIVAMSTAEAEYVAAAEAAKELYWVRYLLHDTLGKSIPPTIMHIDNQAALTIIKSDNPAAARRTRHIHRRFHFTRDMFKQGLLKLQFVESKLQMADIFTKPLGDAVFTSHRNNIMGIKPEVYFK